MYAVIFEAELASQHAPRYLELAADLKPLLAGIEGFISVERFESLSQPGKILSLSWWQDEHAIHAWRQHMAHQAAQREGRENIFIDYRIRVVSVIRAYEKQTAGSTGGGV